MANQSTKINDLELRNSRNRRSTEPKRSKTKSSAIQGVEEQNQREQRSTTKSPAIQGIEDRNKNISKIRNKEIEDPKEQELSHSNNRWQIRVQRSTTQSSAIQGIEEAQNLRDQRPRAPQFKEQKNRTKENKDQRPRAPQFKEQKTETKTYRRSETKRSKIRKSKSSVIAIIDGKLSTKEMSKEQKRNETVSVADPFESNSKLMSQIPIRINTLSV